jgi:hypothetical protein
MCSSGSSRLLLLYGGGIVHRRMMKLLSLHWLHLWVEIGVWHYPRLDVTGKDRL